MRMSCRNIGVLLLTVLLGFGSSMADVFERPLSAKNRPELEKSLAKVMDYQVATGDFKQTKYIQKLNREFVSTGTFRISKRRESSGKRKSPYSLSSLSITRALSNAILMDKFAHCYQRKILSLQKSRIISNRFFLEKSRNWRKTSKSFTKKSLAALESD